MYFKMYPWTAYLSRFNWLHRFNCAVLKLSKNLGASFISAHDYLKGPKQCTYIPIIVALECVCHSHKLPIPTNAIQAFKRYNM